MSVDRVLILFMLGAARAGFLTMLILTAAYWEYYLSTLLVVSLIGGYMTATQFEKNNAKT